MNFTRFFKKHKLAAPAQKQHLFSIGIYTGLSPFELKADSKIVNPVLSRQDVSDVKCLFVADPFMIKLESAWYMFFEMYNGHRWKGEIGLAKSENARQWVYQGVVLSESFHLSYPYVFYWEDEFYMIPESGDNHSIRLYRAKNFPTGWELVCTLLSQQTFVDSSVIFHHGKWWLFTETNADLKHDTLKVFYAENLWSPWREHPLSPVVRGNPHIARPAGRIMPDGEKLIRFAQDCYPIYGTQVLAFEVNINENRYDEKPIALNPLLKASGKGWNANGMHHIDLHRSTGGEWLACVDGWISVDSLVERHD